MEGSRTGCFSVEVLADFACHRLDAELELAVGEHLATCDQCLEQTRRAREVAMTLRGVTAVELGAAFERDRAPVIVQTTRGWESLGRAGRVLLAVGALVREWKVGALADPLPARLGGRDQALVLSRGVTGLGTLELEVTPGPEGGWVLAVRLGPDAAIRSVVVGLGDASVPTFGTRTVTPEREQRFRVMRAEIADLHLHLEWRSEHDVPQTAVLPLPVGAER